MQTLILAYYLLYRLFDKIESNAKIIFATFISVALLFLVHSSYLENFFVIGQSIGNYFIAENQNVGIILAGLSLLSIYSNNIKSHSIKGSKVDILAFFVFTLLLKNNLLISIGSLFVLWQVYNYRYSQNNSLLEGMCYLLIFFLALIFEYQLFIEFNSYLKIAIFLLMFFLTARSLFLLVLYKTSIRGLCFVFSNLLVLKESFLHDSTAMELIPYLVLLFSIIYVLLRFRDSSYVLLLVLSALWIVNLVNTAAFVLFLASFLIWFKSDLGEQKDIRKTKYMVLKNGLLLFPLITIPYLLHRSDIQDFEHLIAYIVSYCVFGLLFVDEIALRFLAQDKIKREMYISFGFYVLGIVGVLV